ncbi:hypothetical protein AVEN_84656-1 [Araneus ventricosus]|uniref:Uncharacterized protein n=1 Tax=Araneus ventricosus TaxID=182803 RepID=A0A4Y2HK63_ARAVE|nr:hypothetical protein AVEN_84656-1 [Araneus ventricosus]
MLVTCQMCSTYRNHCRLRLAWSESMRMDTATVVLIMDIFRRVRFSLQSDSRRTFIYGEGPGTFTTKRTPLDQHRYGGADSSFGRYSWFH